jgi:hypothetical protein
MAEEERSSGNSFKAILTRKIGGVPVWIYALIFVLLLAWWLKRRSDAASKDTGNLADVSKQTFPYANGMPYSNNLYVQGNTGGGDNTTLTWAAINGNHVDDLVTAINSQYPDLNLTRDKLMQLNPNAQFQLSNKYGWVDASNPVERDPSTTMWSVRFPGQQGTLRIR